MPLRATPQSRGDVLRKAGRLREERESERALQEIDRILKQTPGGRIGTYESSDKYDVFFTKKPPRKANTGGSYNYYYSKWKDEETLAREKALKGRVLVKALTEKEAPTPERIMEIAKQEKQKISGGFDVMNLSQAEASQISSLVKKGKKGFATSKEEVVEGVVESVYSLQQQRATVEAYEGTKKAKDKPLRKFAARGEPGFEAEQSILGIRAVPEIGKPLGGLPTAVMDIPEVQQYIERKRVRDIQANKQIYAEEERRIPSISGMKDVYVRERVEAGASKEIAEQEFETQQARRIRMQREEQQKIAIQRERQGIRPGYVTTGVDRIIPPSSVQQYQQAVPVQSQAPTLKESSQAVKTQNQLMFVGLLPEGSTGAPFVDIQTKQEQQTKQPPSEVEQYGKSQRILSNLNEFGFVQGIKNVDKKIDKYFESRIESFEQKKGVEGTKRAELESNIGKSFPIISGEGWFPTTVRSTVILPYDIAAGSVSLGGTLAATATGFVSQPKETGTEVVRALLGTPKEVPKLFTPERLPSTLLSITSAGSSALRSVKTEPISSTKTAEIITKEQAKANAKQQKLMNKQTTETVADIREISREQLPSGEIKSTEVVQAVTEVKTPRIFRKPKTEFVETAGGAEIITDLTKDISIARTKVKSQALGSEDIITSESRGVISKLNEDIAMSYDVSKINEQLVGTVSKTKKLGETPIETTYGVVSESIAKPKKTYFQKGSRGVGVIKRKSIEQSMYGTDEGIINIPKTPSGTIKQPTSQTSASQIIKDIETASKKAVSDTNIKPIQQPKTTQTTISLPKETIIYDPENYIRDQFQLTAEPKQLSPQVIKPTIPKEFQIQPPKTKTSIKTFIATVPKQKQPTLQIPKQRITPTPDITTKIKEIPEIIETPKQTPEEILKPTQATPPIIPITPFIGIPPTYPTGGIPPFVPIPRLKPVFPPYPRPQAKTRKKAFGFYTPSYVGLSQKPVKRKKAPPYFAITGLEIRPVLFGSKKKAKRSKRKKK